VSHGATKKKGGGDRAPKHGPLSIQIVFKLLPLLWRYSSVSFAFAFHRASSRASPSPFGASRSLSESRLLARSSHPCIERYNYRYDQSPRENSNLRWRTPCKVAFIGTLGYAAVLCRTLTSRFRRESSRLAVFTSADRKVKGSPRQVLTSSMDGTPRGGKQRRGSGRIEGR